MAALPCAKEIIDNGARVAGILTCLTSTVALRSDDAGNLTEETAARWARFADKAQRLMEQTFEELDGPQLDP